MNIPWWGLGLVAGVALSAGACFGALAMAAVAAGKRADDERVRAYLLAACEAFVAHHLWNTYADGILERGRAAIAMAKQDD